MVKVVWTESALSDLNDIGEFIAKDSVRYAELTVSKLFESDEFHIEIITVHLSSSLPGNTFDFENTVNE